MALRLKITPKARADLDHIMLTIAAHDVEAALKLVLDLEDRMKLLLTSPEMGRRTKRGGLRELVLGDYVVPYRRCDNVIEIVRVWHGRQRWWAGGATRRSGG
jgi:toxin ParE1/3/4